MTEAIPLEEYYDLTTVSELALSPDGQRVAFVTGEFDRDEDDTRRSLFVVPTDGSRRPHRLTRASDAGSPRWSPDGSSVGFLAARDEDVTVTLSSGGENEGDETDEDEDENADENANETSEADDDPKTQLWVFDLEYGGDARQVTTADTFEDGVSEFDWAPDGERVVVSARDPTEDEREYLDQREEGGPIETERLQHKYEGSGWLDTVRTFLFVVDCESRTASRLDDAHDGGGFVAESGGLQPRWSPGSDRIAFRSSRVDDPDDSYVVDLYTVAPSGDSLRVVTDSTLTVSNPEWNAAGDRLAFVGSDPENWYTPAELYVTDDELEDAQSVTDDLDRTITWGGAPRWLDDETLLVAIGDEGWSRLVRAPADGSSTDRVFDAQGRDRTLRHFDAEDGTVAVVLSHPGDGHDLHALAADDLETDDPELERLTALNDAELERWETPACERIRYESDDGTEIDALAYHPPAFDPDDPEPHPLVVSIHGGPMAYDEPLFTFADACWTSRGYVVLKPNYRGSTSYGADFCETLKGAWNTVEVEDILAGVDAMVDRGWADPDRLFCTGFSQGGVNTAYAITATDRFAAAAAEHGVYDMRSCFGTDDCHNWWENDFGLPWEESETYEEISSIAAVDRIDTPLLVTAGGEDWRCPSTQAEQLYLSVKKQGVPARLVLYPEERHNVGDPDRAVHRLEELTGWFERFDPVSENGA
ncbi:S9 family peptidase [Natronoglomus mannanivorans]|uniref:S9 family peptidase n=1 Tax=Natronoglomus mannanivorans TaxID=2979990 RepID=A0AAP2Z0Z8_9EURY|nr:S9 family peptidase [Halobacteria archaeon AArc-xg1-1]